ncbi:hypothetical protein EON83_14665 [bacterium]|nr:MAG: hypothetical protein EON83_14665 [bacterium]
MSIRSQHALPRKLKRPYFTFFFILTSIFALALVGSAITALVSGANGILLLTALIGGSLWSGFAIGALANWQSLTVFDEHLVFNSFGRKTRVMYREISEVDVIALPASSNAGGIETLALHLHHRSGGKTPLKMNFKLIGAKERIFLLNLLKEVAPSAHMNSQAERLRQKR